MGTANVQSQIWGVRARDWAEVQEGTFTPLFAEILQKTAVTTGTAVLDVGCGSGLFCAMAAKLGAKVSGLDASEPLLAIARERAPQGDFRTGEMEELPYPDQAFDLVTGLNSFQFAADQVNALRQARRVLRPGACLVIGVFGRSQDTDATPYMAALASFLPPPPPGAAGPFSLSSDGALEALVTKSGMTPSKVEEIDCPWVYPDDDTMLRGLLASGPAIRAMQAAGEAAVRDAVLKTLAPFKTASGGYHLRNTARYVLVRT